MQANEYAIFRFPSNFITDKTEVVVMPIMYVNKSNAYLCMLIWELTSPGHIKHENKVNTAIPNHTGAKIDTHNPSRDPSSFKDTKIVSIINPVDMVYPVEIITMLPSFIPVDDFVDT